MNLDNPDFEDIIICGNCNVNEGFIKKRLKLKNSIHPKELKKLKEEHEFENMTEVNSFLVKQRAMININIEV